MTKGLVRSWEDDEGWGIIDSPETPGGCWAHFSNVEMPGFVALAANQRVDFSWMQIDQDGFQFRATKVRIS